ncbi:MAG: transposase [Nocardioidaceae bacterium]|nr:transposase [Nocardioidaceae bacterium]
MNVIVVTADQRGSRAASDAVPTALERLDLGPGVLRAFDRTAGDEIQGVLGDGATLAAVLEALLRDGRWQVGVGIDAVESPLPASTRAGRGPAFVAARTAVGRAKTLPGRVGIVGADVYRAEQAETVAMLLSGLLARRSEAGWQVADLLAAGLSHAEAGARLGISQPAVSQRAQAAGYVESVRAAHLLGQLADEMLGKEPP